MSSLYINKVKTTADSLSIVAGNLAERSFQFQRDVEAMNTTTTQQLVEMAQQARAALPSFPRAPYSKTQADQGIAPNVVEEMSGNAAPIIVAKKPITRVFFYSGSEACHSTKFWIKYNATAAKKAETEENVPEEVADSSPRITLQKVNDHLSFSPRKATANTTQQEEDITNNDDGSPTRKSPTIKLCCRNGSLSLTPTKPSASSSQPGKDVTHRVTGSSKATKWISASQSKPTVKVAQQQQSITLSPEGQRRIIQWQVSPTILQKHEIPRKSIEEESEADWFLRQRAEINAILHQIAVDIKALACRPLASDELRKLLIVKLPIKFVRTAVQVTKSVNKAPTLRMSQRQKDILNRTTQAAKVTKKAASPDERIQLFNIQMAAREAAYLPVKTTAQIAKEEKQRLQKERKEIANRSAFTHHRTKYGKMVQAGRRCRISNKSEEIGGEMEWDSDATIPEERKDWTLMMRKERVPRAGTIWA